MAGLSKLVTWTQSRTQESLNGTWSSIIDVYDVGASGPFGGDEFFAEMFGFPSDRGRHSPGRRAEYDFNTSETVEVPGDWNTQHERFHFYEGSMWFRRRFHAAGAAETNGRRTIVLFGAANHSTWVYLNGKKLAEHEGGYGPFCVELTGHLRHNEENSLIVRVNNQRTAQAIPTTRTDWFNYGGLTRDVTLFDLPATFIRDAVVQLCAHTPDTIQVEVWLDGPEAAQDVSVKVGDISIGSLRTNEEGYGSATFPAPGALTRWSPSHPVLHTVTVSTPTDSVADNIGFRTVSTSGSKILVNGQHTYLSGISLHDEALGDPARRIKTADEARRLLQHAKDLGCNFVRLAHYQHNEHTVRACDELGLMAWAEVPVYWGIDWDNPATLENGKSQLRELIERDRNRAAIILWSVANETHPQANRTAFLRALVAQARSLDNTRLVTAALFSHPEGADVLDMTVVSDHWVIDDPLGEDLDVLGINEYHGWYYGTFEAMARTKWTSAYDKPVIVSEFGADAKGGLHGSLDESWTEEFQAEVYRHQLAMLAKIPFLAGTTPWILKDFRAPFRLLPGIQDGFNRKGLIDNDGNHKLAYDVQRSWYREHKAIQARQAQLAVQADQAVQANDHAAQES
jgi:beta-glucuronidase